MIAANEMQLTYAAKLQDPRWQAKRLEVLERAGRRCEDCGATDCRLEVHHRMYARGRDPWDYPDAAFVCCCVRCHKTREEVASLARILFQMADPIVAKAFLMTLAEAHAPCSLVLATLTDQIGKVGVENG